jgi:hypothetical protein
MKAMMKAAEMTAEMPALAETEGAKIRIRARIQELVQE